MAVNDHHTGDQPPDESDARIASLYKRSSREAPPTSVDRRIAAAARAETRARIGKPLPWWMVWRLPLATAAIAVVSASLIAVMLHEDPARLASLPPPPSAPAAPAAEPAEQRAPKEVAETRMSARPEARPDIQAQRKLLDAPHTRGERRNGPSSDQQPRQHTREIAPAPEMVPPAAEAVAAPESAAPVIAQPRIALQERAAEPRAPEAAATSPAPAAKTDPAPKSAPSPEMRTAPSAMLARPKAAAKPPSLPSPPLAADTPASVAAETRPPLAAAQARVDVSHHVADLEKAGPAAWLERVRALRREGRVREAETLLTEFRKRYPSEAMPADLQ
jgi:hypothetical protein